MPSQRMLSVRVRLWLNQDAGGQSQSQQTWQVRHSSSSSSSSTNRNSTSYSGLGGAVCVNERGWASCTAGLLGVLGLVDASAAWTDCCAVLCAVCCLVTGRGTDILLGGNPDYMARLKLREMLMPAVVSQVRCCCCCSAHLSALRLGRGHFHCSSHLACCLASRIASVPIHAGMSCCTLHYYTKSGGIHRHHLLPQTDMDDDAYARSRAGRTRVRSFAADPSLFPCEVRPDSCSGQRAPFCRLPWTCRNATRDCCWMCKLPKSICVGGGSSG
jgi:hypothetical protein